VTVRTLIVDDDARVADIHKGYVERVEGFAVAGVANRGTEALRRVLEDAPDLVLLDIYLPDLSGLEVCRRLRAANNLVDVIAVTAARDVDTVKGAVGLGVAQYLVKPFTPERFAAAAARARAELDADRTLRALEQSLAHAGRFLRLDTREVEGPLRAYLEACGLLLFDTGISMSLGRDRAPEGSARIYGLASHSLG